MKQKEEIYEEVLKEEPDCNKFMGKDKDSKYKKAYTAWEKRLHSSIGWVMPLTQGIIFVDETGKQDKVCSSILDKETVWDVVTERGSGMTHQAQETAEIHSLLLQMNFRLKRIEDNYQQAISELKEIKK